MQTHCAVRRPAGVALRVMMVAALHVGFGALLVTGLAIKAALAPPISPVEARVIPEKPDPWVEPPPAPGPTLDPIGVGPVRPQTIELADPTTDVEVESSVSTVDRGEPAADTVIEREPVITSVRSDPRHPLTQPPYPPAARRLGEEGVVIVGVWVLPDGQVGDARIEASSGFTRLDAAAVEQARRWRLKAATRDTVPFAQWYSVRVVFRLDDR